MRVRHPFLGCETCRVMLSAGGTDAVVAAPEPEPLPSDPPRLRSRVPAEKDGIVTAFYAECRSYECLYHGVVFNWR